MAFWEGPDDGTTSTSRIEAEQLAAKYGGTVHRITVIDDAVGLRWVKPVSFTTHHCLYDGPDLVAIANVGLINGPWYALEPAAVNRSKYGFDTLKEAMAEAERAYKETWT